MAHISSTTRSNREKTKADPQEAIKHLLEEVWDFDPEKTFFQIFSREAKK